jgi:hypothetical protein
MFIFFNRKKPYELKRSKVIRESLKLGRETIKVEMNVDLMAKTFGVAYKKFLATNQNAQLAAFTESGDTEKMLEACGNAVIGVFEIVFGKENAEKIFAYYEDNYLEMATQVMPFINDVIVPQVNAALEDMGKAATQKYITGGKRGR